MLVCESLIEFFNINEEINVNEEIQRYSGRYIPSNYSFETRKEYKKRTAKEFLENNIAYLGTFRTIKELKTFQPEPYDWVLRSADGDGALLVFNGDLASEDNVNELKKYYHHAQDINYLNARPITYKRWLALSPVLQMASRRDKKE